MNAKRNIAKALIKVAYFKAGENDGKNGNISIVPHYADKLQKDGLLDEGDREKVYTSGHAKGQAKRIDDIESILQLKPAESSKNKSSGEGSSLFDWIELCAIVCFCFFLLFLFKPAIFWAIIISIIVVGIGIIVIKCEEDKIEKWKEKFWSVDSMGDKKEE